MAIDYKKELESAAKSMILVHDPEVLIKMIVRLMIQKVKVIHAGILLHDAERDIYILRFSRGLTGLKIPEGFARMDVDNPLIRLFKEGRDKHILDDGVIIYREAKKILNTKRLRPKDKKLLAGALKQMEILDSVACIPSYFQDRLPGIMFLGKKKNRTDFTRNELDFFVALASDVAMAIRNAQLFKELKNELDKRQQLFIQTVTTLAAAIEAKDHYTRGHTERVTELSLKIAKKLLAKDKSRYSPDLSEHLRIAALLHDIGKIGVPEDVLNKEGPLEEGERKKMQLHTVVGATILQPIQDLGEVIKGVKYHHERYDGGGYPEGLKGDEIPLIAAIISTADTFDAMTSDRPYRKSLTQEEAIAEIKRISGKQLVPEVAEALVKLYEEENI